MPGFIFISTYSQYWRSGFRACHLATYATLFVLTDDCITKWWQDEMEYLGSNPASWSQLIIHFFELFQLPICLLLSVSPEFEAALPQYLKGDLNCPVDPILTSHAFRARAGWIGKALDWVEAIPHTSLFLVPVVLMMHFGSRILYGSIQVKGGTSSFYF